MPTSSRGRRATCLDAHHTVEDIGITLGQAFAKAIGDKAGVRRFGHAYVPLDEALSRVVIDFSGRPGLEYHVEFTRALIGEFDVDLVHEFFQGFVNHAQVTLHIDNLRGDNAHHQCETIFKAFARALRMAAEADPRAAGGVPSRKALSKLKMRVITAWEAALVSKALARWRRRPRAGDRRPGADRFLRTRLVSGQGHAGLHRQSREPRRER